MKKLLIAFLFAILTTTALAESAPSPTPDPLRQELAQFVHDTTKTIESAKAFSIEQAPDIMQQYLVYSARVDRLWLNFLGWTIVAMIIGYVLGVIIDSDMLEIIFLPIAVVIIFGISFVHTYADLIKIQTAPKVYLLEYAKTLVK